MRSAIRLILNFRLLPLLLVIACGAILAWSSLRAYSAWHFLAAEKISEPLFANSPFDQDQMDSAEAHLQRALRWFPNNPDFVTLSGRLKELQASQPGVLGPERQELLQGAANDYRHALELRPLWPYSWANLLGVKSRLNEVDEEFRHALARCAETGPWEPRVQIQVIESGFRHWDQLGRKERDLVEVRLAAAVTVQPRAVYQQVRAFGRADLLCPLDVPQPQIENYCQSLLNFSD